MVESLQSHILALLRKLPVEVAHPLTLQLLQLRSYLLPAFKSSLPTTHRLMGLSFPNRCGIAAGLDKNGDCIRGLQGLGVGFIELGTVTPLPQPGNPKPRIWRLVEAEAVVNRLGFNNKGVHHLVKRLSQSNKRRRSCVLGANIGKGINTPLKQAAQDYLTSMRLLYKYADYICVNISSPNTSGLRSLQYKDSLSPLLMKLKEEQALLNHQIGKYTPLVVKIAPDLSDQQLKDFALIVNRIEIDGVIATNTTIEHQWSQTIQGGLSGRPLSKKALATLMQLRSYLNNGICLIGTGGIASLSDMEKRIAAGADLIQVYTALIYQGLPLLKQLINYEVPRA